MEDPVNANMKLKRFYRHGSETSYYLECDARLAAKFDQNSPYFIDNFSGFPEPENKFFYQRTMSKNDVHSILLSQCYVEGLLI